MIKLKNLLRKIKKIKNLSQVLSYFEGVLRYKIYYSKYKWLIRSHIHEQIRFRLKVMNQECYSKGSCVVCGCEVPELQMCTKTCDGNCYPPLMNKDKWNRFFWNFAIYRLKGGKFWIMENNKPSLIKETAHGYEKIN